MDARAVMKPVSSTRLRPATAADAALLTQLRRALFDDLGRGADAEGTLAFERACEPVLGEALANGTAMAWLVEDHAGAAVATAMLLIFPRLPTPRDRRAAEGYLLGVFTVPAWRRRGLARTLVTAAIEEARRLGLARVRLSTSAEGRALYAALGFRGNPNAMELVLG